MSFDEVPHSNSYRPTVPSFDEFEEDKREPLEEEEEE